MFSPTAVTLISYAWTPSISIRVVPCPINEKWRWVGTYSLEWRFPIPIVSWRQQQTCLMTSRVVVGVTCTDYRQPYRLTARLIVCDVICSDIRTRLEVISVTVTALFCNYNILQLVMLPILLRQPGLTFQHVNDRPHTVRDAMNYLHACPIFPWTAWSNDLPSMYKKVKNHFNYSY